jgi:hypothetical protein
MSRRAVQPLIDPAEVRETGLGVFKEQRDSRNQTVEGVKGVVIRVFPVDHPANLLQQTLVDVQVSHRLPLLHFVPVASSHGHQETPLASPGTRFRNPYDPKERNQIEGHARDLRPGTIVWVHFENRDLREPVVTAILGFTRQGQLGFPIDKHVVFDFAGSDDVSPRERFPLHSSLAEYPRAVESFNGSRREVDNKGNILEQTTIDRLPVFPGHNGIPASPPPEGSKVTSTKGAAKGNIGRFTGIHDVTGETNEQGNFVDESKEAGFGNHIRRLIRNFVGRRVVQLLSNVIGNSEITLEENGQGSYSLDVLTNGVGNWRVGMKSNGSGSWAVVIESNGTGDVTRDIKTNGSGKYAVRSQANGDGSHVHSSTSDGDGHMERTIESGGEGSLLDSTKNSGRGVAFRQTESSGDGSILDQAKLGGVGWARRRTEDCADGSILDEALRGGIGKATRRTEDCVDGSILDEAVIGQIGRADRRTKECLDGTIRDQTDSDIGHIIHQTKALSKGWHWTSARESIEGKVYVEDRERKGYWFLDPDLSMSEAWAALKVVLSCNDVRLGSRGAPHNIVLWPQLDVIMQFLTNIHDTHVHPGVTTGEDSTLPPPPVQLPYWLANGPNCRSDVVRADKAPSAEPFFQDDPDAGVPA